MDHTDRKILQLIQEDANLTHKQIAGLINMSTTPVYERIKRMERSGIISKYVALLDPTKIERSFVVYTSITLKEHALEFLELFEKEINQFDEVQECYHMAGQFDYLLKIVVTDINAYHQVVKGKLATMNNIGNLQSSFVMGEVRKTTKYNLTS
ncbi:MAG: Lrp/AsnC family transcriptional regulator [Cyclobacteriaceae bacterium]